jgi:hypothetical protein
MNKIVYIVVLVAVFFSCQESKKQKVEVIEEKFHESLDDNENPDPEEVLPTFTISQFEGNEHYFIRNIDINNDGILDKIVSAVPHQGDELLLFIKKDDNYEFALKTINFSEDGGHQIMDVLKTENGFEIFTAFPDRGLLEAHHHIKFSYEKWIVKHTIYRTKSGNDENAFNYNCKVNQNIDLSDKELLYKLNLLPDEGEREKVCEIEVN